MDVDRTSTTTTTVGTAVLVRNQVDRLLHISTNSIQIKQSTQFKEKCQFSIQLVHTYLYVNIAIKSNIKLRSGFTVLM